MQVFMEMFERSGTPSQSINLESGAESGSKKEILRHQVRGSTLLGVCGHSPLTQRWLESSLDNAQSLQKRVLTLILYFFDVSGRNFGQVAFCNNPVSGLILLIGVLVASPKVAAAGVLASTISIIFALATNHPREGVTSGGSGFNAVLFGLIMKSVVLGGEEDGTDEATEWVIIAVGAAITVVVTNGLGSFLGSASPSLPCLSLPFNLVAVIATLTLTFRNEQPGGTAETSPAASPFDPSNFSVEHSMETETTEDLDYVLLLQGSLLGVGQVIAVNDLACSGLILLSMLVCSPLLTLAAFAGSLLSTFLAAAVSPFLYDFAYNGLMGYNGFLTAAAVMFFFVPGKKSVVLATAAVVATLAAQISLSWAFNDISLPIFSLPFVGVSLAVLGSRGLPRPMALTFPEHHIAQWREAAASMSAPLASLSMVSISQQSLRSSTITENRWRRTPSL